MKLMPVPAAVEAVTGVRPPSPTWRRWILTGMRTQDDQVGRIRLSVTKLGGRIYTTEANVREFIAAINGPKTYSEGMRVESTQRGKATANKYLDGELGFKQ